VGDILSRHDGFNAWFALANRKIWKGKTKVNPYTILSLLIALCAVLFTAYGLAATRRHNRLSVTPHLNGCSNSSTTNEGLVFSYDISNNGIGPARIKKFILFRDGKPFPKGNGDYVESLILEHLGEQLKYQITYSFNFGTDASLKSGDTCRIVEILFLEAKSQDKEKILKNLEGLDLCIEYESFYRQKFVFRTENKMGIEKVASAN
jgi:hypothetical protein